MGELDTFELTQYYEEHYAEAVTSFPPFRIDASKYYAEGLDYFNNFNFPLDKYNILGVEKEIKTTIPTSRGDIDVIGYIDLLLEDKETKEITILDHKSAKLKWLKSGKISKTNAAHWLAFQRQLYLYSKAVMEEYGRPVGYLEWNMFRTGDLKKIPWVKEDYEATLKWVDEAITNIYSIDEFEPLADRNGELGNDWYCMNLCGQSENCEYRQAAVQAYLEKKA